MFEPSARPEMHVMMNGSSEQALEAIAASRSADPLAPVTVVAPSHAAGIQMRRRLVEMGPFAGVRFETLARVAELLAAGRLAARGISPLARPIGDYLAQQAALQSSGTLARVADLPGYARALRAVFRRLRGGGIRRSGDVRDRVDARVAEVLRLYGLYRELGAEFYDDEDLYDAAAAAVREGSPGVLADLGEIYVAVPAPRSAGAAALLAALRGSAPAYHEIGEATGEPENQRLILAPDPASETREVVREVLEALEAGVGLHEIAVFHGADASYPRLLREAFDAAEIPSAPLPGVPLIETPAGKAVLGLVLLPEQEFSRTATMDLMNAGPLRDWLPGNDGQVRVMAAFWDRLSRDAGVTRTAERWSGGLAALIADREAAEKSSRSLGDDVRADRNNAERREAERLQGVIEVLSGRLAALEERQPARTFISKLRALIDDYVNPDAGSLEDVRQEVDQLGTVGAVGGTFDLATFAQAIRANLQVRHVRPNRLGDGVVVADYRAAAGLAFKHVVLSGVYEGAFPAGPIADSLIEDRAWERLRLEYPFVEDARARLRAATEDAGRAIGTAAGGTLVWSAPLYEPGGRREYYPAPMMVAAAAQKDSDIGTASALRRYAGAGDWLRRGASPFVASMRGAAVDMAEARLREAVRTVSAGRSLQADHPRGQALSMLRARRSRRFTEWDGNLASIADDAWFELQKAVSPTSLEHYGACGFKYFCRSLLRLNVVEEPSDRDVMEPAVRGSLVHRVLQRFFEDQKTRGRPALGEAWGEDDTAMLMDLVDDEMSKAKQRGQTGLEVYAQHDTRSVRADLRRFLAEDTAFRRETGAVPAEFEASIPEHEIGGVRLRGVVDRIDRSPDGRSAWVIDYKTGSTWDFKGISDEDQLAGGRKLQLPAYVSAAGDAAEVQAMYWFISRKGEFRMIAHRTTPESRQRFERTLGAIVGGVREGSFPAISGEDDEFHGRFTNCTYCDFDRICSRRRDIEFAAKAEDPGIKPWSNVERTARGKEGV